MISPALKKQLDQLRQTNEAFILAAAQELPGLRFNAEYADGYWDVEVEPDGTVYNNGYARELHGLTRQLSDLKNWELGKLLDEIQTRAQV